MKIVYIPHSFPGPLRHTMARLALVPYAKILAVTDRSRRDVRIPGVRRIFVPPSQGPRTGDRAEYEAIKSLRHGANIANTLLKLRSDGFTPDMVVTHAGHGCSLYAQDIFPEAYMAVYADWFHTPKSAAFFVQDKNFSPVEYAPYRIRNFFQWNALSDCNLAVTSTEWQKSLYPSTLRERIHVIHEGIDTDFFSPEQGQKFVIDGYDLSNVEELLTFSGRKIGADRGFPQFLRSLPHILKERPKCHVLIMAGSDSKKDSTEFKTLQEMVKTEQISSERIHFVEFRPYAEYRMLLRASTVHVFFTAPHVLSTGLFEAMSCGCLVVGANTEPLRETIEHGTNGFLCDFWDETALAETVINLLQYSEKLNTVREAARATIREKYNVQLQSRHCAELLLQSYIATLNLAEQ